MSRIISSNADNVPPGRPKKAITVPIEEECKLSRASAQQEISTNTYKQRRLPNTDSRQHNFGTTPYLKSKYGIDDSGCAQLYPPRRQFNNGKNIDHLTAPHSSTFFADHVGIIEEDFEKDYSQLSREKSRVEMRELSKRESTAASVRELIERKRKESSLKHSRTGTINPPLSVEYEQVDSVFAFNNVGFVVGKGNQRKDVLTNINHTMKSGELLAIMGPSGAGKTSLLNVLTLSANFGNSSGSVMLDKKPMDDDVFRRHCFIVKQEDKHWDYLTAKETLIFAGELFRVAETKEDVNLIIDKAIDALGLVNCADTKCVRLSGGEKRRLSLAVALLKTPTVMFLDEPTSGLDSASALAVANEISRVAREARMIIICVIHQPSTRVFSAFDQVMILSRGCQAYTGNVEEALMYFQNIGYPLPYATNPAEHFLDLVNSDFSDVEEVERILRIWDDYQTRKREALNNPTHAIEREGANNSSEDLVADPEGNSPNLGTTTTSCGNFGSQLNIMLRRQFKLAVRDPMYYLGRCGAYLATGLFFSFVYWHARPFTQAQAVNKVRVISWLSGVPAITSVVAVYATSLDFHLIQLESKNGMVHPFSYVLAREILTLPTMILFAIFGIGIPGFTIQNLPSSAFGTTMLLWSAMMYVYESIAAALGIWFGAEPILGMLVYAMIWFITYLFSGMALEIQSMYWPFKAFYYANHLSYYLRSVIHVLYTESTWESCDPTTKDGSASVICVPDDPPRGEHILDALTPFFGALSSTNSVAQDSAIILGIAMAYKLIYISGVIVKTRNGSLRKGSLMEAKGENETEVVQLNECT